MYNAKDKSDQKKSIIHLQLYNKICIKTPSQHDFSE